MISELERRVIKLERSNRRWRESGIALLLAGGVAVLVAAEKPLAPAEIIQAKRIELVGADGKAVIVLESKADQTSLAVFGPDHEHVAILVAQPKKAAMMLLKNREAPEVFAQAVDTGGEIGVTNGVGGITSTGKQAVNMIGSPTGCAIVHVVDGRPESRLSFSQLGGGLELRTPGSKAVTRVIGADRGGRVEIVGAQGQVLWSAPTAAQ